MKTYLFITAVVMLGITATTYSNDDFNIEINSPKAFYEFGGIPNAVELGTDTIVNQWVQRFGGMFDIKTKKNENFEFTFGMGGIFWHAIPEKPEDPSTAVFFGDAIITKAYGSYKLGDPLESKLLFNVGYFPLKYSNSRNLGEYLFSTGTYPNYIITGNPLTTVNTSRVPILGLSIDHIVGDIFQHSLFFTSEKQSYPLHDFSLSYLAKMSLGFFDLGMGLKLNRLIPITPSQTTPTLRRNTHFNYQGEDYTFYTEYYYHLSDGAKKDGDSVQAAQWTNIGQMVDSLYKNWDTTAAGKPAYEHYSFKGINTILFASLNFNELSGMAKEDFGVFNLYSEAVLMGVENKPVFYENRMDRLAVMLGLNVPTFGILNELNFELEYFPSKFVNGFKEAKLLHIAVPDFTYNTLEGYDPKDWNKDDLKWSIYVSRNIIDGITLEAQIASDHLRGRRGNRVVSEQSILVDKEHWYYMFKLQAAF